MATKKAGGSSRNGRDSASFFGCHLNYPYLFVATFDNINDLYLRKFLSMTILTTIVLTTLFLEYDNFLIAHLLHYFSRNQSTFNNRGANKGSLSRFANHQHFIEFYFATSFARDFFHANNCVGANLILLPACFDDCEHKSYHSFSKIIRLQY